MFTQFQAHLQSVILHTASHNIMLLHYQLAWDFDHHKSLLNLAFKIKGDFRK